MRVFLDVEKIPKMNNDGHCTGEPARLYRYAKSHHVSDLAEQLFYEDSRLFNSPLKSMDINRLTSLEIFIIP